MGAFGLGMVDGVLRGLELGSRVRERERRSARADRAVDLQEREAERRNRRLDLADSAMQRKQDLQDYGLIFQAAQMGKINERMLEKSRELAEKYPLLSLDELLSPRAEAALTVAGSIQDPADLKDPAKLSAANYVLTLGQDPNRFVDVRFDSQNPDTLLARDRQGKEKPIKVQEYQNHLLGLQQIRQALQQPETQQLLSRYAGLFSPGAGGRGRVSRPELVTVYDERTGRERKGYFDAAGKFVPVGGVKAAPAASSSRGGGKRPDVVKAAVDLLKEDGAYWAADAPTKKQMLLDTIATLKQGYGLSGAPASAPSPAPQASPDVSADDEALMALWTGGKERSGSGQGQSDGGGERKAKGLPVRPSRSLAKDDAYQYAELKKQIQKQLEYRGEVDPGVARAWIRKLQAMGDLGNKNWERTQFIAKLKQYAGE